MNDIPQQPEPALVAVKRAIDELETSIQLSRLQNDPLVHLVRAMQTSLKSHAEIIETNARAIADHRSHIDRDFTAIRQSRHDLSRMTDAIVKSAKAEVEAAHAETARQVVASIARSAEQKLAAMSKIMWWRTIVLASAVPILALLIGAGAGYWRGYQVGHHTAATTIRSATPIANAVLARSGPTALHDWNMLMTYNPIQAVMSKCHGNNIAQEHHRTVCKMWMWITPYVPPVAHASDKGGS
jgi:hypothetical protein